MNENLFLHRLAGECGGAGSRLCDFFQHLAARQCRCGQTQIDFQKASPGILDRNQIDHRGFKSFVSIAVRENELDKLQEETSIEQVSEWAGQPNGLVRYYVKFKKSGTPKKLTVVLHPSGEFIGFQQTVEAGEVSESVSEKEFRAIADRLLRDNYAIDPPALNEVKFDSQINDGVAYYRLDLSRPFEGSSSVNEIFAVTMAGPKVTALGRRLAFTAKAKQEENRRRGPSEALSQFGYLLMGISLVVAYIIFLFQLRAGQIELVNSLKIAVVLFLMVFASSLLDSNSRYTIWDPVWPGITMWLRLISQQFLTALWALVLGWALLSAGSGAPGGKEKTASFDDYVRFRWTKKTVAVAALRGGALGFVCGAVAIVIVKLFESLLGGEVGLQPRAFFLSMLDRQIPALAIVLFFFPIAVVEEAGYRLLAASWIRKITGSKIVAIVVPAIVFGLIHTSLGFLPPENPWWGRALVMFVIGLIWGWAFFKFDFLTVVLSHFMADVVIFSWPLLMSEYAPSRVMASIGISVALWPALVWMIWKITQRLSKYPNRSANSSTVR